MTNEEFEELAAKTRLGERGIRMAREVLVYGLTRAQAARKEGVTHEQARRAVATIAREYKAKKGYPEEWETRTVVLPPEAMDEVRAIEDRALKKAGLKV